MFRDRIKELRRVKASELQGHPKNWRTHPEDQKAALGGILTEVGFVDAVMARELPGGKLQIIDGHLRAELDPDFEVPVLIVDLDDAETAKVLATFDPLGAMAEANKDLLDSLLKDFTTQSNDVLSMLEDLAKEHGCNYGSAASVDEDDVPDPPVNPRTKKGDVWILGKHRLMCGDSTSPEDVGTLMNGEKAAMCFTDPPWNVAIGLDSNPRHRQRAGLTNDKLSSEDFQTFLERFIVQVVAFVKGDLYCVLGASEWPRLDSTLRRAGFHWSATIIWVKDIFVLGRSKYHRRYEPLWYGWHEKAKSSFGEARDLDDVWEIPRPRKSEEHPTMKPVALVARAITNSSQPGDLVFEPFSGSGSTMIAAEQLGRRCNAMEIDPGYVDVAVSRWEAITLRKAHLAARLPQDASQAAEVVESAEEEAASPA